MIPLNTEQRAALVPSSYLQSLPWIDLVMWCHRTARYGLVTNELVEWLQAQVGSRKAIEIGAGQGDLGYHLGVHMTDSAVQLRPDQRLIYATLRQQPTNPPPDVERIDAATAVAKHKPDVVIGSWITQRSLNGDEGFIFGVDEVALISSVETYIRVGNVNVHGRARALALPHREYAFPWLWSRAMDPRLNRIWVWDRGAR